jgi:hypothetical protein
MMEAVRTSETSVDNHSTRQYNPEDSSEHYNQSLKLTIIRGIDLRTDTAEYNCNLCG